MGTPDVLMIEAAPGAKEIEQAKWRNGTLDESVVDALPYIDHDYADPKVKAEVDKMIAEEMRVSSKKPADFLAELPAVPSINPQVLSLTLSTVFTLVSLSKFCNFENNSWNYCLCFRQP